MKRSQCYYLKDGKLDLSLLDEDVCLEIEPITYHVIHVHQEQSHFIDKEKLYGSLETYEILKEMGAYLSDEIEEKEFAYEVWQQELEKEQEQEEEAKEVKEEDWLEEGKEAKELDWLEEAGEVKQLDELEQVEGTNNQGIQELEELENEGNELEKIEEIGRLKKGIEKPEAQNREVLSYDQIFSLQMTEEDREILKQYQQPETEEESKDSHHKKHSKVQLFRAYQLKLLQGRVLTEDIISPTGVLVGRGGERITAQMLELAREENTLIKIILKYL